MKKLIIVSLLFSQIINAELINCETQLDYSLPNIWLGNSEKIEDTFWTQSLPSTAMCFDESELDDKPELLAKFLKLKKNEYFDENNCLSEKIPNNEADYKNIGEVIQFTLSRPIKINAITDKRTGEVKKIVLSSIHEKDEEIISNALTTKDKLELAGITLASTAIGRLVEAHAFKSQHDKMLHANYGAIINIGSNLASYVVIEEFKLGDKLNLSRKQKKMAILLTGTVMGALIGYGKERFYDYYRRKTHTYDPNFKGDMGATMLGGGAVTPLLLTFSTSW
jgi:hypothetical protein